MTAEDKVAKAAGLPPPIIAMIRGSGRSWWQAQYRDGRVLSEWDTMTSRIHLPMGGKPKTSRWEEVNKKGLVALRLLCPNGMSGELRTQAWPFFQLKIGELKVGVGTTCDAHVIGLIDNAYGDALCYAWETQEKRLFQFTDNVHQFHYRGVGALNLAVQGIK